MRSTAPKSAARLAAFLAIPVGRHGHTLASALGYDAERQEMSDAAWACPTAGDAGRITDRMAVPPRLRRFVLIETIDRDNGNVTLCPSLGAAAQHVADDVADLADRLDEYGWQVVDLDAPAAAITVSVSVDAPFDLADVRLTHPNGAYAASGSLIRAATRTALLKEYEALAGEADDGAGVG